MQKCCQTLSETAPRLDRSKINDFADKATALSLDLLTTVPPMVSDQPKCKFDKKWLEKDSDSWHNSCSEYELAYYRPVLFKSSAGIVAREGLVGNRKHVHPPALPNQTECVQDQLRLNSDYPTKPLHMQAPLPTPSVSYSCDRSSQTQLVPEREHRKKKHGTGNEHGGHCHYSGQTAARAPPADYELRQGTAEEIRGKYYNRLSSISRNPVRHPPSQHNPGTMKAANRPDLFRSRQYTTDDFEPQSDQLFY